ncbi:MAG: phosphate ABC transporter substrate-binding protein [Magnetococcales bacterium]|nr:phosphate ABC transporter substrate-binding protein [Magnetococcales bacterium]
MNVGPGIARGGLRIVAAFMLMLGMTPAISSANDVTWTGCGITKKAFMKEVANAYQAKTGVTVQLSGGGATKGVRAASAGTTDIGGTCRHRLRRPDGNIHDQEEEAQLFPVAWDGIVMITHPSNPVENINLKDLKAIYRGEITSWKSLGGPDRPIILATRDGKYSGTGHMFRLFLFQDQEFGFKARSLVFKSTGPLEKKVGRTPYSLALDGISSARKQPVKILKIDGIAPSKENIANGRYPLFRPLYLALNKNRQSEAGRKVVDFVLSDEGQAIISDQGTVNLHEGRRLNALWNARLNAMGL